MMATTLLQKLGSLPIHFSDCCPGISKPLVSAVADRLPEYPALTLSIGSGSGLLEAILLEETETNNGQAANLYGVEVPPCVNTHLPDERVLRVPCTMSLHPDAMLASALMFVYPRNPSLVTLYLDAFIDGALEKVLWLGHRSDWPDAWKLLRAAFYQIELVEGPGFPEYELLAVATLPKCAYKESDLARLTVDVKE